MTAFWQKTLNNPGYKAIKYKAVISFSNEEDLWKEWEEIYTDLSNDNHEADAREFFERHREKMLEGHGGSVGGETVLL